MASLDCNLEVEREASEVGYISDPRFPPVSKASDGERKTRLSLIDIEDDTKRRDNISCTLDKPPPLDNLCKSSGAPSLDVPPTPPKRVAALLNNNNNTINKQSIPHPTPILKLPPLNKLQKNQGQFQNKQQPLPPLPEQKPIPSLSLQANEGPSTKENITVPSLSEKKPLTPVKEPETVHPPQKSFRIPLPVKNSDMLPIQKAPVPPPRKGNTFPLPRKENAFKLPTPTRDSPKPLASKDYFSKSFSTKLSSSISKNKFPLFKDDQIKDTLKNLLPSKEHGLKPKDISTVEETHSKRNGHTFSRLKETKFKMLQGFHDNNVEGNQQLFSPKRRQSRFSSFFNQSESESNTSMKKDLLLLSSTTKNEQINPPQINNSIKSPIERENNDRLIATSAAVAAVAVEGMEKSIYKGNNNTTTKGGIASSLSFVNRLEGIEPLTFKNNSVEHSLSYDNLQKLPAENIPPTLSDSIKKVTTKSSLQTSTSMKEAVMDNDLDQDNDNNSNNMPSSLPNMIESNTMKSSNENKPPLPKRKPKKAEMSNLGSPNQTVSLEDGLKTSTTYNKNEDTIVLSESDSMGKKTISRGLRLTLQTNNMYKPRSKGKLPKPTSIFNGFKSFGSEKESIISPSKTGSLKKKGEAKKATDIDATKEQAAYGDKWPSSPKMEVVAVSPRSTVPKTTIGNHQIKPHISHRELSVPSPRANEGEKMIANTESRPSPPPPPPKRSKSLQEPSTSRLPTPKKDIIYSSNHNHFIAKSSDWRKRLDKPPPPPPLIINRNRFSHSKMAIPPSLSATSLHKQESHHFKVPVPQLNTKDDGTALEKLNSPLPIIIEDKVNHDEVPTPGGIKSNLPLVLPKLPPKTFLPDIAPPLPPKRNILPPPVKIPFNPARHKELIPIPEPIRLSLDEDYPNKTIEPDEVFHVEYRERTNFRGVQWCFDEYLGIYHKKIPGFHQSLPHISGNTKKLSRSQSAIMVKPKRSSRTRLSLSRHKEPIYPSFNDDDDIKWSTPTSVREVRLMRKESKKLRDKKAQLSLCRVLIEASADNKEMKAFNAITPHFTTKYSPKDLRKKKRDMVFDEVLVLEAQRILKGLVMGRDFPDAEAEFLLANCYGMGGLGFPLDRERAFSLYIHASKQNHIESIYRAAVCYELGIGTRQDNSRAVSFYRKAATYSHVSSMYKLGMILLRGYCGQTKNIREALSWLQRAAAASSNENQQPHALYALAMLQLEEACPDTNLIADATYAINLLHASAKLDYAPSQVKLGELYESGQWVEEDDALSIYWYTKAAQAGNPDAALALSCWYLTGSTDILEQSDQEALLWAYKAATSQQADRWTVAKAMFLVGIYIENGATSSKKDANTWFKRAAALGHKGAAEKMENRDVKAISYTE